MKRDTPARQLARQAQTAYTVVPMSDERRVLRRVLFVRDDGLRVLDAADRVALLVHGRRHLDVDHHRRRLVLLAWCGGARARHETRSAAGAEQPEGPKKSSGALGDEQGGNSRLRLAVRGAEKSKFVRTCPREASPVLRPPRLRWPMLNERVRSERSTLTDSARLVRRFRLRGRTHRQCPVNDYWQGRVEGGEMGWSGRRRGGLTT